jgi:hypothetical protein
LTVHQPYAALIVNGDKDVENRTWFASSLTEWNEPLLIHAAQRNGKPDPDVDGSDVKGAIIGGVWVARITRSSTSPWAVRGMYHWELERAVRFRAPIPCPGQRNLWTPAPELMDRVPRRFWR